MYMEKNHEEVQWVEMAARNQGMANYSNERKRQNGGKIEEKPLAVEELVEPHPWSRVAWSQPSRA